jgi:hypothetical protein
MSNDRNVAKPVSVSEDMAQVTAEICKANPERGMGWRYNIRGACFCPAEPSLCGSQRRSARRLEQSAAHCGIARGALRVSR